MLVEPLAETAVSFHDIPSLHTACCKYLSQAFTPVISIATSAPISDSGMESAAELPAVFLIS
jgi:hypothetical protein